MKIVEIDNNSIELLLSIVKSYQLSDEQLQYSTIQLTKELQEIGDNRFIYIATSDDKSVAMIQLVLKNADNDPELANGKEICHLHNLQVIKNYQNQGIGRMMMDYVETQAKQLEKKIITLGVDGDNARAIKLYKNRSYITFKQEPGRTVDEVLYYMRKDL